MPMFFSVVMLLSVGFCCLEIFYFLNFQKLFVEMSK